jgi:hypothetical protein
METVLLILVPGLAGGLVLTLILLRFNRRRHARPGEPDTSLLGPEAINMAHIRVAGVGGLGLVATALVVAIFIPRIGVSLAVGLALGTVLALGLILRRRGTGPMPSSGRHPGANTSLSIDSPDPAPDGRTDHEPRVRRIIRATADSV